MSIRNSLERLQNSIQKPESNNINLESYAKTPINSFIGQSDNNIDNYSSNNYNSDNYTTENSSWFSSLFDFTSIRFWVFLILILALFGFNIFNYLGKGTDIISNSLSFITSIFGNIVGDTSKTIINTSNEGSKKVVDLASNTINKTTDTLADGSTSTISTLQKNLKKKSVVEPENSNHLTDKDNSSEPEPIRSVNQKQGYCYIGKINDTRYCAKVDKNSECLSGDIFPSKDICINPNLRG